MNPHVPTLQPQQLAIHFLTSKPHLFTSPLQIPWKKWFPMVPLLGFAHEQNNERIVGVGGGGGGRGAFHLAVLLSFPSPSWLLKSQVLHGPLLVAPLFILS